MKRTRNRRPQPWPERFWKKVDVRGPDECWPWQSPLNHHGYGQITIWIGHCSFRNAMAHRVAFELANRPIPSGLEIDHLCRNRRCVNPAHLEAVTRRENQHRGYGPCGINARKTHCPQGHPYAGANLYTVPKTSYRQCRACQQARYLAHKAAA